MSDFLCRVGMPDGRVLEQVFEAPDETVLRGDLLRRGLHVFEVRRKGFIPRLALPAFARRTKRVPIETFLVFNQELAALLRAGLPLLQAIDLMLERLRDPVFRAVLTDIRDRVKSGEDLSQAFAAYGDTFPPLYASSLRAGEKSGELESVIRRFIRYTRLLLEARRKVFSALVYPLVLVTLSVIMILIMTIYVVPRFMTFFADLEIDQLPLVTRVVLALSGFLRGYWYLILGGLVLGWIAYKRFAATEVGRREIDRYKLRIPFMGGVLKRFALAEFARSLATLLSGGIPLVQALEIAVSSVGNLYVRSLVHPTVQQVREGQPFYGALEKAGIYDPLEIDMVKVGEATGSLDQMLQSVSEFLDEQIETRMARLLTLVEPLMLVFMGIIVAILLVAIYLPMFSMMGQSKF
ncbi:MAG: type II secretion system F family protein [Acidobacteriota bacterium]